MNEPSADPVPLYKVTVRRYGYGPLPSMLFVPPGAFNNANDFFEQQKGVDDVLEVTLFRIEGVSDRFMARFGRRSPGGPMEEIAPDEAPLSDPYNEPLWRKKK